MMMMMMMMMMIIIIIIIIYVTFICNHELWLPLTSFMGVSGSAGTLYSTAVCHTSIIQMNHRLS
jgi:hypothetical protein